MTTRDEMKIYQTMRDEMGKAYFGQLEQVQRIAMRWNASRSYVDGMLKEYAVLNGLNY